MKNTDESDKILSERVASIRQLISVFSYNYLNTEYEGYCQKLLATSAGNQAIHLARGKTEIWAASIIYTIARLNFLFDKECDLNLPADTICDYFDTKKSTVGNKATLIERECNLFLGAEGYCCKKIIDQFTLYHNEGGLIFPRSMLQEIEKSICQNENNEASEIEKKKGADVVKEKQRTIFDLLT